MNMQKWQLGCENAKFCDYTYKTEKYISKLNYFGVAGLKRFPILSLFSQPQSKTWVSEIAMREKPFLVDRLPRIFVPPKRKILPKAEFSDLFKKNAFPSPDISKRHLYKSNLYNGNRFRRKFSCYYIRLFEMHRLVLPPDGVTETLF